METHAEVKAGNRAVTNLHGADCFAPVYYGALDEGGGDGLKARDESAAKVNRHEVAVHD